MKLLVLGFIQSLLVVRCDLPIHCLPEDVLGHWTFVIDDAPSSEATLCGHSTPNTVTSMLALVGDAPRRHYVPEARRETVEVLLTNHVEGSGLDRRLLAIGSNGEKGQWTVVFDEGFEVRLGGRSYFAHFEFETLPGKQGKDGDTLKKIGKFFGRHGDHNLDALPEEEVYACHCERTSIGWHSRRVHGNSSSAIARLEMPSFQHGCFFAYRSNDVPDTFAEQSQKSALHIRTQSLDRGGKKILSDGRAALRGFGNSETLNFDADAVLRPALRKVVFAQVEDDAVGRSPLPTRWDWREQPELSQPGDDLAHDFDQGACGSCYAHAGVLSLGMRFRIALSRKFGHPSSLDLSWRGVTQCSPFNEGCQGGWPFLVGRHSSQLGVFQKTTQTSAGAIRPAIRCNADLGRERDPETCAANCFRPNPTIQPVYFAADYGYVGGFSQGASEEAIMREIFERGPVAIELAVSALPLLISGNSGKVIMSHNNERPLHDIVRSGATKKTNNVSDAVKHAVGHNTSVVDFKDWLWTDHVLLAVGWGEVGTSGPGRSPRRKDDNSHIMLGTPLQLSLIQSRRPDTIKYWTIRNSWGNKWADGGYGKLVRGQNAGGVEISAVWIQPDMSRLPHFPDSSSAA